MCVLRVDVSVFPNSRKNKSVLCFFPNSFVCVCLRISFHKIRKNRSFPQAACVLFVDVSVFSMRPCVDVSLFPKSRHFFFRTLCVFVLSVSFRKIRGKKKISTSRVCLCGNLLLSEQPKERECFSFFHKLCVYAGLLFVVLEASPYVGYSASFVLLRLSPGDVGADRGGT